MSAYAENPPEGYYYKWVTDERWKLGTSYTRCRQPRCPNPPIAELARFSVALQKARMYAYCKDHLYGRRIMGGKIKHRRLVPNASC